jgi:hypothetical protein
MEEGERGNRCTDPGGVNCLNRGIRITTIDSPAHRKRIQSKIGNRKSKITKYVPESL